MTYTVLQEVKSLAVAQHPTGPAPTITQVVESASSLGKPLRSRDAPKYPVGKLFAIRITSSGGITLGPVNIVVDA